MPIKQEIFDMLSCTLESDPQQFVQKLNSFCNAVYGYDIKLLHTSGDINEMSGISFQQIDGIKLKCFFAKGSSSHLYVAFNGARAKGDNYYESIAFSRWSYYSMLDGCFLAIDDPMYADYPDLTLGWYYGNENRAYILDCLKLIQKVCELNNIPLSEITFLGSSGGGYAALMASLWMPSSLSVSINPQLFLYNYFYAAEFQNITKCDLARDDKFHRNDPVSMIPQSSSHHLLCINSNSVTDVNNNLLPLMKHLGISIRYGLTIYENLLILVYRAKGMPDPHNSVETKYIFWNLLEIAEKFKKGEMNDIAYWQRRVLMINEMWADLYEQKYLLYQKDLHYKKIAFENPKEIVFLPTISNIHFKHIVEIKNVVVKQNNNNYNAYKLSITNPHNLYRIVIHKILSSNVKTLNYSIYDFEQWKIIKKCKINISDSIDIQFVTGGNIEGVYFLVYAGEAGYTKGKSIEIPCISVGCCPIESAIAFHESF